MAEPVSATVTGLKAVGAAAGVAKAGATGFAHARKRFRFLGTFDAEWLSIANSEDAEAGLNVSDAQDIKLFLTSPQMEPVLAFFAISKLSKSGEEAADVMQLAISNEARRWVAQSQGKWIGKLPFVIARLNALYDGTFKTVHVPSEIDDEVEFFSNFVNAPLLVEQPDQHHVNYLDRLIGRMTDLQALVHVLAKVRNLASAIAGVRLPPIATHTDLDGSFEFEKLYVPRTFRRAGANELIAPSDLSPTTAPFRVVIMGDPGAGKSTFVRHYKKQVSSAEVSIPVVEVSCRRWAKSAWEKSALAFALETIEAEHCLRISTDEFESMLLLGRVCLIFDGLDEITQRLRRAEVVQRIESVAGQYPVCSVLVTTRILGYGQASLSDALFDHLELDQFDYPQFEDYCDRWFRLQKREDLITSFIADSGTVDDLRYNPLMLALLCALYREHGSIPADRREVYRQCADLLFRRWDAHRQIEHDSSMPKFADRLMQEIAHVVYNSPIAQGGVGEVQLVKILAQFLIDRGGYDAGDAETASRDFVEFCANRAWLLGSFGSDKRGQRIFGFTHRTFLEYFAAEAMTRRANGDDDVIEIIKTAYNRDRTSVVPELMIQAYDFRKENGGPTVLRKIAKGDVSSLLLLRLMAGVNVPFSLRSTVFEHIVSLGLTGESELLNGDEFDMLLNLHVQAREQFIELVLTPDAALKNPAVTRTFCTAWAAKVLHGSAGRLAKIWDGPVKSATFTLRESQYWVPNAVIGNWLVLDGIDPKYEWTGVDAVMCVTNRDLEDRIEAGVLWRCIHDRFAVGQPLPSNEVTITAIMDAYNALKRRHRVPAQVIQMFADRVRAQQTAVPLRSRQHPKMALWHFPAMPEELDKILREVLIWTLCAMRELLHRSEYLGGPIESVARGFWDGDFEPAIKFRSFNIATDKERAKDPSLKLDSDEVPLVKEFLRSVPPWLRDWFYGRASYVVTDDERLSW
ncbi:hypothetical protein NJB1507_33350 [Mycobacterium marinum]|uniref:NACHT domain-containing protein n=1 Tax=Mycobacterium marinum TaxID=1781 RepID=UPI0021C39B22|nr:NACHT domain-containing protein [Mycobacterium marinum]GJO27425.1 hypothetical protein NJB1507_33350 [Mycobacterium marinum]